MDDNQRSLKGKFTSADANGDGRLDSKEFGALVHPHRHERMVEHIVRDQLLGYDKNQDGVISRKEYLGNHSLILAYVLHLNISPLIMQLPSILTSYLRRTYLTGQLMKRLTLTTSLTKIKMAA